MRESPITGTQNTTVSAIHVLAPTPSFGRISISDNLVSVMTGYGMGPVFYIPGLPSILKGKPVSFPLAQVSDKKAILMICSGLFFVKDLDFFRFIKRAALKNA